MNKNPFSAKKAFLTWLIPVLRRDDRTTKNSDVLNDMKLKDFLLEDIERKDNIILLNNKYFTKKYTPKNQNSKKVKIIFIGNEEKSMNDVDRILNNIKRICDKSPNKEYILLLGKGDYVLDNKFASKLPSNVKKLYGCNNVSTSSKISSFPVGRDFRNNNLYKKKIKKIKKDLLCYCNFSLNTHDDRKEIFEKLKNKSFIKFEHMGRFRQYPISRKNFLKNVARSKYCICPRGNAPDTFRFWDCLYLGTIPIVVHSRLHKDMLDLPILFLKNIDEYSKLTEEFLEKKYEEFLEKKYNYEKLKLSYWFAKIEADQ